MIRIPTSRMDGILVICHNILPCNSFCELICILIRNFIEVVSYILLYVNM